MPWSMRSARSKRRRSSRYRCRGESFTSFRDAPLGADPESRADHLWIPGSRGACHRAALCADPLARPGMTSQELTRCYCAGATGATPPVGTVASAVLVDLVDAACGFSALTVSLAKRSCTGLAATSATAALALSRCGSTSATASVVTRLV